MSSHLDSQPSKVQLPWGVKPPGNLIHIGDAANGLKCELSCATCKGALNAKQGSKLHWHFAHVTTSNCSGNLESHAHRRAKEILAETKKIFVPELGGVPAGWRSFENAKINEWVTSSNRRRLDLLLSSGTERLGVEIFVKGSVERKKAKDLQELPYPCIELYINATHALSSSEEAFVEHVRQGSDRSWILTPQPVYGLIPSEDAGSQPGNCVRAEEPAAPATTAEAKVLRLRFMEGTSQLKAVDEPAKRLLLENLRTGQPLDEHKPEGLFTCEEISSLLAIPIQAIHSSRHNLKIPDAPPWGVGGTAPENFMRKLSLQGLIAICRDLAPQPPSEAYWQAIGHYLRETIPPVNGQQSPQLPESTRTSC